MSLRRYTVPLVVAVYALYVVWWGRQGVVASVTSAHDVRNERNATLGFASYVRQTAGATSSRLQDQLAALRRFSDDPYPAVTRVLFTENDVKARAYVRGLMADAGLEVAVDGMGSIIGSWRVGDGDGWRWWRWVAMGGDGWRWGGDGWRWWRWVAMGWRWGWKWDAWNWDDSGHDRVAHGCDSSGGGV